MREYICIYDEDEMQFIPSPYADAEELIRCKNCRWFLPNESKRRGWCSFSQRGYPKADDYCSDAERKSK